MNPASGRPDVDKLDQALLDKIAEDGPKRSGDLQIRRVPTAQIHVQDRQRNLAQISQSESEALVQSILNHGLLHPIVLRQSEGQLWLVAGERRLEAWRTLERRGQIDDLGIPANMLEDLSSTDRKIVELEENLQRKNLSWKEESLAFLKIHEALEAKHRDESPDEEWPVEWTADHLGFSPRHTGQRLMTGRALVEGDEQVHACDSARSAFALLSARITRKAENELLDFIEAEVKPDPTPSQEPALTIDLADPDLRAVPRVRPVSADVLLESFLEAEPLDPPANFIHCDFPYGIQIDKSKQFNVQRLDSKYSDDKETYFSLLKHLLDEPDLWMAKTAHIFFWFPMKYYSETLSAFRIADFWVDPYPCVWHKADSVGIVPDPRRGPRRTYETALIASRGDRKIIRTCDASVSVPAARASAKHASEKPVNVLVRFFGMFVDQSTRLFDPTCGSGTALVTAEHLGARSVLGMDISEESVEVARNNLRTLRVRQDA